MLPSTGAPALPTDADIDKLVAQLRDDMTQDVRTEVADRLVQLGAAEPHPQLKAALLAHAARLVGGCDAPRAIGLLREAFRLFPAVDTGRRLAQLAADDPAMQRLDRLGHLVDAVAELTPTADRAAALLEAARAHLAQGHGRATGATLDKLAALVPDHPELAELREIASQQVEAREQALTAQRMEIATCPDDQRPGVLLAYAELLLAGDEPLADAAAVLADAVDAGASLAEAAPLWVEVARATGEPDELRRALSASLQAGDDLPTRLQHADELANLPGIDHQHPDAALRALEVLVAALPDDTALRARRDVVQALLQGGDPEPALEDVRQRALRDRDRTAEGVVSLALAQLAQGRGDLEKAERHFRRVRTLMPQNGETLDFFEAYYRSTGDHKRLLVALTQRLAASEGKQAVRVAQEMAELAEGPLAAPAQALEAWQRVLAVQPDHPAATAALLRLYETQGRWHALRDLLDRSARALTPRAATDPPVAAQAVGTLERLAQLHDAAGPLPDADLAAAAYRRLLKLAPRHAVALAVVTARLEATGDVDALVQVLEAAATASPDEAPADAATTAELCLRAADLCVSMLDDQARAAALWTRALQADPARADVAQRLQAACRTEGDTARLRTALLAEVRALWGQPVTAVQPDALPETAESARVAALLAEAAALPAGAAEPAEGHLWSLLLAAQPGHPAAVAGLRRGATGRDDLQALAARLAAIGADLEPALRVALLEQLAEIHADLGDAEAATAAAAELRTLAPDSSVGRTVGARALLERAEHAPLRALYPSGRQGAGELTDAMLQAAGERTGEAQVRLLLVAARALTTELGEAVRGAMTLAEALQGAEALPAGDVRTELVLAAGEPLLEAGREAGLIGLQRLAADALATHGPADALLKYKQIRVDLCADAGLWSDGAAAAADLVEEHLAAGRVADVLPTLAQCLELATSGQETEAYAHRFAAWAEILEDDDAARPVRAWLWRQAAALAVQAPPDHELARRAVDAALTLEGDTPELLQLREQACTQAEDWTALVDTLARLAAVEPEDARADLLLRAAGISDVSLDDHAGTERLYRQVLATRPTSYEAWTGLLAAARRGNDEQALGEALDGYLALPDLGRDARARAVIERLQVSLPDGSAPDPLPRLTPLLAVLAGGGEPSDAEEALIAIALGQLELPERARTAAEALLPALQRHGRVEEALRCLDVLAKSEPAGSPRAIDWYLALAALTEREAPDQAYTALRSALLVDPGRTELCERLAKLAARTGNDADFDRLLLALVGEAELPGVQAVADTAVRTPLATLRAERALQHGDAATAAGLYTLLHALTPQDLGPLDALEALYREASDLDAVAFVLEERLVAGGAAGDRLATYLRLASLHSDEREAPAEAEEVLARAAAEFPRNPEAWGAWLAVLRGQGHVEKLAAALQQRLDLLANQDTAEATLERRDVQLEAANLYARPGAEVAQALPLWLSALEVDPADDTTAARVTETLLELVQGEMTDALERAADRLEPILEARGDWPELDALLTARTATAHGQRRSQLLQRQAFLRERGLVDPATAFECLAEALLLQPEDEHLQAEIRRLGNGGTAAHPPALRVGQALAAAAGHAKKPDVRRALRLQALTWLAGPVEGQDEARRLYEAMLAEDPGDEDALAGLDQLIRATGDERARLGVLQARAKATTNKADQTRLLLEHARLADSLGEDAAAVSGYRGLLDRDDAEIKQEAAAALCALHERRGELRELADSLMVLRGAVEDTEGRLALTLRAASVLAQTGDRERARHLLHGEEIDQPRNADVYLALEDLLRGSGDRAAFAHHLHHGWTEVYAGDRDPEQRLRTATEWLHQLKGRHAPGRELWHGLREVLDAGLRSPDVDALLAETAAAPDADVALPAARKRVALLHDDGDAAAEVAARAELVERFADQVDVATERVAIARLFETRLDDRDAALHQWLALLATGWDEGVLAEAWRLADLLGRGAEADEVALAAAAGIDDGDARDAARMRLVERAYGRDDMAGMADLLDLVLAETPDHAEAYAMRGAVLTDLPGWHHSDRLVKHYHHGIAHLHGTTERRQARLALAAMLHDHLGRSGEAFDLVRDQLAEDPDAADASELALLAERYGVAAGRHRDVRALLAAAVAEAAPGPDRADRLIQLAERSLEQDSDVAEARRLAQQALAEGLTERVRAIAVLDVVAESGLDPALLDSLLPVLRTERPARAADLLQRGLRLDVSQDQRLAWLRELAALAPAARAAGEAVDPVLVWRELALLQPREAQHWQALQAAAGLERAGVVQDALLTAADATEEPDHKHDLLARAAACAEAAGDLDTATTWWRLALEAQDRGAARDTLHGLLAQLGRYEELALDLEMTAEIAPERAPERLGRAAGLRLVHLGEGGAALAQGSRLAAAEAEQWATALAAELTEITDAVAATRALAGLGPLLAIELLASAGSLAAVAFDLGQRVGLDDAELEPFAVAAAVAEPARLDAALWLEDRLRAQGQLTRLAERLDARARRQAATDPAAAVDAWMQLADLCQADLPDPARAALALDAILGLQPDHEGALRMRLQAATAMGDHEAVARVAEAVAAQADDAEAAELYLQRARALLALDRREAALDACELALAGRPGEVAALVLRAELLGGLGRDAEARTALVDAAVAKGDATAVPLLVQAAEMARMAGDTPGALDLYGRAVALAPTDAGLWRSLRAGDAAFVAAAAEALAQALREAGQAGRLADLQASALQHLPVAQREAGTRDLAATLARDVGDAPRALDLLLELARTAAAPVDVLQEAADIARTADLLDDWIHGVVDLVSAGDLPAAAVEPAVALAAAAAVERGEMERAAELWQLLWDQEPDSVDAREAVLALRREAGDPQRLAADLARALMFAGDAERMALRLELAELEKNVLGRPREALRHVADALSADPRDAQALDLAEHLARNPVCADEALRLLEPLYRAAGHWPGVAGVLKQRMERAPTASARADLAQKLAQVQEKIGAGREVAQALLLALQAEPKLATLEAIERSVDAAVDGAVLARAYDVALASPLPPDQRYQVLTRAAAFDRARHDLAQAERRLRAMVDLRPDAPAPFEALESLLDEASRWTELIELLRHRLGTQGDAEQRRLLLHRLGGLSRAVGQADVAIEAYRELAQLDPGDTDPHEALVDLLRDQDAPAALAEALAGLAAATPDLRARAQVLAEAARLYARQLQLHEKAADLYGQAFAADPGLDEAFVYLERHADHAPGRLQPLYARRAEALPPGPTRTLILRRLATACGELHDGAGACQALEQALQDDPANSAVLDELLRAAELHRQWPAYVTAAQRKLAGDVRRDVQVALVGQLARVALTELPDAEAAARHVAELQRLAPGEPLTRHVLALLQAHSGDPHEAAAGLEQMVKEADDPSTQIALHQQLADLYAGPLNNPAKAIREYQRLIALDPRRWSARRRLCDLYAARKSPEAHAETLKQWLTAWGEVLARQTLQLGQGGELVALYIELGQVLANLGHVTEAADALSKAHSFGGDDMQVNPLLSEMAEATGDLRRAAELEDWVVEQLAATDPAAMLRHACRAGRLWQQLGKAERARDAYKRALDVAHDDDEATLGSARACLALGETDRAMRLFDAISRKPASTSVELRALAHIGMGRCRMTRLQLDQARACYERALMLVPGHPEALAALAEL